MTPCPAIIERTHYGRYPKPPLSPSERIESWRRKWARLTVEETLPSHDAMVRERVEMKLMVQR